MQGRCNPGFKHATRCSAANTPLPGRAIPHPARMSGGRARTCGRIVAGDAHRTRCNDETEWSRGAVAAVHGALRLPVNPHGTSLCGHWHTCRSASARTPHRSVSVHTLTSHYCGERPAMRHPPSRMTARRRSYRLAGPPPSVTDLLSPPLLPYPRARVEPAQLDTAAAPCPGGARRARGPACTRAVCGRPAGKRRA